MKIIQKIITSLKPHDYYVKHLQIINPFLPLQLTPTEIEVLAAFMCLKGDLVEKDRFATTMRKEVKTQLGLSDGGMSNHIRHLTDKGAIYKDEVNVLKVRDFLFPEDKEQGYQFKITKDE